MDNGPIDTLSDRRFADTLGGCNLNGGHFVKDRGKQPAPLGFCELRQSLFQQPFQFHALQRLVRLLRQIQRIRLDAVACVQRVERPVVADVLRVVDLKPPIFFEKRSYFIGNLDKGILGVPRVKLPQVCLLYTSPSPRDCS